MSTPAAHRTIVIGLDGSAGSRTALSWGLREAERRRVPVLLAHAFGPSLRELRLGHRSSRAVDREALQRFHEGAEAARILLSRTGEQARATHPMLDLETVAINERAGKGLVECSRSADLLVVGTHGAGSFAAVVVGSTVMSVASRAACTVVAVPPPTGPASGGRGIVVGVDPGAGHDAVLARAFAEADLLHEPLTAVHAVARPSGRATCIPTTALATVLPLPAPFGDITTEPTAQAAALAAVLAPWQARYPRVTVRWRVVHNHAPRALAAEAHGARLLVVGSRANGRRSHPLGSVSHAVLHLASCPVAVVHPAIDLVAADRVVAHT
jgi:nucleotide-binding universal stress UspA family protein